MNNAFLSACTILVCLFFLLVFTNYASGGLAEELIFRDPWKKISLDLEDASLLSVLKVFSQQSGMNFIAAQEVADRTVTLYLENVPIRDALDKILKTYNLTYELDEKSNIFVVKEFIPPPEPEGLDKTITKVYILKYARVNSSPLNSAASMSTSGSSLVDTLNSLISADGKISEDSRTNSLIITDIPERFARIEEMIRKLDVPIPQVLIEAEIIDVKKSLTDQLGMLWSGTLYTLTLASRDGFAFPFNAWHNRDEKTNIDTGSIAASGTAASLQLLLTDVDTKVLARPRILTLSNETAEIKITGNDAVGTVTTIDPESGVQNTSAERYDIGVTLKVTPVVNAETGEITMALEPTVSSVEVSSLGTSYYDPQERSAKTTVCVKSNETVVIGGLLRKDLSDTRKKMPLLGDIPLAGLMFRHKSKTDQDRELLVFITPHIVGGGSVNLTQSAIPTYDKKVLSEREQSDYQYRKEEIDKALNVWDNK
jgi:type IV pilus secretin PilQ/predicted competence protein